MYWSQFRQVKNCLLTVWPTTPQPLTQIFAANFAVRSNRKVFAGPSQDLADPDFSQYCQAKLTKFS
ncbi:hypothetical protein [Microcoleus sp. herbarium7]|uniref:hypothetical protein n=1 Tax=Microcoleus sp. herbarium7 TaxID=3055435 RepID=UPI002FD41E77